MINPYHDEIVVFASLSSACPADQPPTPEDKPHPDSLYCYYVIKPMPGVIKTLVYLDCVLLIVGMILIERVSIKRNIMLTVEPPCTSVLATSVSKSKREVLLSEHATSEASENDLNLLHLDKKKIVDHGKS